MDILQNHLATRTYGENPYWMQPYQCFMGRWEGLCKTFSPKGDFIESSAVHMDVYWLDESKSAWHLHEDFDNLYEVGKTVFHTDLQVTGNTVFGDSPMVYNLVPFASQLPDLAENN